MELRTLFCHPKQEITLPLEVVTIFSWSFCLIPKAKDEDFVSTEVLPEVVGVEKLLTLIDFVALACSASLLFSDFWIFSDCGEAGMPNLKEFDEVFPKSNDDLKDVELFTLDPLRK